MIEKNCHDVWPFRDAQSSYMVEVYWRRIESYRNHFKMLHPIKNSFFLNKYFISLFLHNSIQKMLVWLFNTLFLFSSFHLFSKRKHSVLGCVYVSFLVFLLSEDSVERRVLMQWSEENKYIKEKRFFICSILYCKLHRVSSYEKYKK